jgi:hypothetical protein
MQIAICTSLTILGNSLWAVTTPIRLATIFELFVMLRHERLYAAIRQFYPYGSIDFF